MVDTCSRCSNALTLEKLFANAKVESGRLWYCTQAGNFTEIPTTLDQASRGMLGQVVLEIRRALEESFFPRGA